MTANTLWDDYISDAIYNWDIYDEWTKEDIEQVLLDEKVEYTSSDIDDLYEMAIDTKNDLIGQDKESNIEDLWHVIDDTIADAECATHLNANEIGRVLVSLAYSYFNNL